MGMWGDNALSTQDKERMQTMCKRTKTVAYARVATQEQANSSYSLEVQKKTLREYAEKNNLEIVKEFSDTGSGLKSSRKGFNEMLKFLEDSTSCKTILVTKADRLSRDFKTLSELQEKYSVLSADCSANNMLNQLQMMFTQQYSKLQSERIKAGIHNHTQSNKNKAREWVENWVEDCTKNNVEGE